MYYERETGGFGPFAFLLMVTASSILVVVGLHMLGNFVPGLHLRDDGVVLWLLVALVVIGRTRTHMRTPRRGGSRFGDTSPLETRMTQEIHNGLGRLEERIETLETLLLESRRTANRERENVR